MIAKIHIIKVAIIIELIMASITITTINIRMMNMMMSNITMRAPHNRCFPNKRIKNTKNMLKVSMILHLDTGHNII